MAAISWRLTQVEGVGSCGGAGLVVVQPCEVHLTEATLDGAEQLPTVGVGVVAEVETIVSVAGVEDVLAVLAGDAAVAVLAGGVALRRNFCVEVPGAQTIDHQPSEFS